MTENPLLQKLKLPGRIFQLPSRGLLYTNGEINPSATDSEIMFHALTAFEEIELKNPDLLFSGKALSQVLKTTAPQILKPDELYSKDVDCIMLFLRLVTYGPSYELSINHGCEGSTSHSYIVDLEQVLQNVNYLDPTLFDTDFKVHLENGQIVQLQPVKYKDVIAMLKENEKKEKLTVEDMKRNLHMSLMNIIKSVDGIEDKTLIAEWITQVPAANITKIADQIEATNKWGPNLDHKVNCKDCGKEIEIEIPINTSSLF